VAPYNPVVATAARGGRLFWRVEMFGGLRAAPVSGDGGAVAPVEQFQTYKTAALFARLAFPPQARHSREALAAELWPDAPPEAVRNRLTQALVWLRPRLEPEGSSIGRGVVLLADRASVGLAPEAVTSDVAEFEAALRAAEPSPATSSPSPESVNAALCRAVALYRGDLLPALHEEWVIGQRERLRAAYISALRRLAEHRERTGDYDEALALARTAVAAEPLMEEAHCDLMRLLARTGRPAAALRQFRELERTLADEFGEEPSPEARALAERVRRRDPALVPPDAAVPAAPARPVAAPSLPAPLTRFIGRAAELKHLRGLLRNDTPEAMDRLITLIGPGGAGKTRLAVEAARGLAADYGGEVWFVPLSGVADDPRLIPGAIAAALRLSAGGRSPAAAAEAAEQVVERLTWRRALLVLDNLEHLAEGGGAAPFLRSLLERCPALTLLVTSRQRLGIDGEREVAVPPLSAPGDADAELPDEADADALLRFEAVQLFVDRAQAVRPSFHLTRANAAAVAAVCGRLDGLPLAIELCAAWAQTLTPAQIRDQLERPLDLLVSRRPASEVAPRHRSLRDALEYSYRRLAPDLRRRFCRLSVFRGGWTLDAAAGVLDEDTLPTLDALTALRERSLILADGAEDDVADHGTDEGMRYRMLETLRGFAEERLREEFPDDIESLRRRHAAFFLRLAEEAEGGPGGAEAEEALRLLEAEHDNLRAVLAWAAAGSEREKDSVTVGLRLAGALAPFWDARGHLGEGRHWLSRLLALSGGGAGGASDAPDALRVRARALTGLGHISRNQGSSAEIDAAMVEALTLWRRLGDERGVASCLQAMATIAYSREGGVAAARSHLREGLTLARRLGDPLLLARTLLNLGNIGLAQGEWDAAQAHYEESLALYRDAGSRGRVGTVLNNLGLIARYRGDTERALPLFEEAYRISEEGHNRAGMAVTAINRATVLRLRGAAAEGRALVYEAARWAAQSGDRRLLPWCVREMGHLACAEGDHAAGVRLLAAAEAQRLAMGITFKPADPEELERAAADARVSLGEGGFAADWAAGSALTRARVYSEALHLSGG
jgi:predicted ATPase/DNA-binding SARP family transcriptional activator